MIIEVNSKLLDMPEQINLNQLVFLSMILDKNQKPYQDVQKIVSLISDDEISYLINQGLITSMERGNSIIYQVTDKVNDFVINIFSYCCNCIFKCLQRIHTNIT